MEEARVPVVRTVVGFFAVDVLAAGVVAGGLTVGVLAAGCFAAPGFFAAVDCFAAAGFAADVAAAGTGVPVGSFRFLAGFPVGCAAPFLRVPTEDLPQWPLPGHFKLFTGILLVPVGSIKYLETGGRVTQAHSGSGRAEIRRADLLGGIQRPFWVPVHRSTQ